MKCIGHARHGRPVTYLMLQERRLIPRGTINPQTVPIQCVEVWQLRLQRPHVVEERGDGADDVGTATEAKQIHLISRWAAVERAELCAKFSSAALISNLTITCRAHGGSETRLVNLED
jgi:hypothetical protein